MSIIRKVKAVNKLFLRLDEEIRSLQKTTGLHCLPGCGKCCTKPDIEASPLEFLPLAFEWLKEGKASEMLEKLMEETSPICINYSPLSIAGLDRGSCGTYFSRGLICRLFGFSAIRDKNSKKKLVTCKPIKEDQPEAIGKVDYLISENEYIPMISDYYKQLAQIDFKLGNQLVTINRAIRIALEEVLQYYAYRPYPRKKAV